MQKISTKDSFMPKNKAFYWTCAISLSFLLLNIVLGSQLNLTVDAAHYALYGQHLAWSYFDHPPLVGWLQGLVLNAVGTMDYCLRLWPWFLSLATVSILYFVVGRIFIKPSPYLGLVCILFFYNAVILYFLGFDLLPQTPLLLFALLIAYTAYRITEESSWKNWLVLGLLMGLAGLADYTALMLVVGVFLYFLFFDRKLLFARKPYFAACLSFLLISPVIYWNWQHDWVSFYYQFNHGFDGFQKWNWDSFIQSIGIQWVVYSPALIVFAGLGVWKGLSVWQDKGSRLLICLALPILLLFIYSGGHGRILPHWPAVAWLLLIPLAARYVLTVWQIVWVKIFAILMGIVTILFYIFAGILIFTSWIQFDVGKSPFNDLRGWPGAAQQAKKLLADLPPESQHLLVSHYSLGSRLAWYSQLPVQVTGLREENPDPMQFDLWYGKPVQGMSGILVVPINWDVAAMNSHRRGTFATCQPLDELFIKAQGRPFSQFSFYYCRDFIA